MHDAGGVLCQRHAPTGRIQALRIGVFHLHSFHVSYSKASYLRVITKILNLFLNYIVFHRYADIIVHRLLAVCIGADATYPELLDKKKNHLLCHNLNYRNRMAQYAGRASVALHTHVGLL